MTGQSALNGCCKNVTWTKKMPCMAGHSSRYREGITVPNNLALKPLRHRVPQWFISLRYGLLWLPVA